MKYEAHLTVEEVPEIIRADVARRGVDRGWHPSWIFGDLDLGVGYRLYFTKHGPDDVGLIEDLTSLQKDILRTWDVNVVRKKVEQIVYDVRL